MLHLFKRGLQVNSYNEDLISQIAWYYYMENMTQQEISDKIGISRMKIVKLLDVAKKNGIIQFKISDQVSNKLSLSQKLRDMYRLKEAYVVPFSGLSKNLNDSLAQAAAYYLLDKISDNAFINMGYGDTLSKVLNHMATIADNPISVISMTGGVNYYLPNIISSIFKAKLYLLQAPLILSSSSLCEEIKKEKAISDTFRMIKSASISVVGIGSMDSNATIISNGILTKNDFTYLSMKGAVGDILTHFIDKDGNLVKTDIDDRIISTSLETLKSLKNVIGIAGGTHKVKAIRAALLGGYLDSLITDEYTAVELCG